MKVILVLFSLFLIVNLSYGEDSNELSPYERINGAVYSTVSEYSDVLSGHGRNCRGCNIELEIGNENYLIYEQFKDCAYAEDNGHVQKIRCDNDRLGGCIRKWGDNEYCTYTFLRDGNLIKECLIYKNSGYVHYISKFTKLN